MKKRNDEKILSIRMSLELYEALKEASRKEERSVSQQVRYLIREYIKKERLNFTTKK